MTQQTAAAEHEIEQRSKLRGKPWPPGTSGNPSGGRVSKRFTELFNALLLDFGGELSAVDHALLSQACRLMIRSERTRDNDSAVRLANASARLLAGLRNTKRRKHETATGETFAEIAARAQKEADQRRARELAEDEAEPSLATPVQAPSPDAILGDTGGPENAFNSAATMPAKAAEDEDEKAAG